MEGAGQRTGEAHMSANVYTGYGPSDVFQVVEVVKPIPEDNEVLLSIRSAPLHLWDFSGGGRGVLETLGFASESQLVS